MNYELDLLNSLDVEQITQRNLLSANDFSLNHIFQHIPLNLFTATSNVSAGNNEGFLS